MKIIEFNIKKICFLSILFTLAFFTLGIGKINNHKDGKIYKNIYIESINLDKMTKKEAKNIIDKYYRVKPIKIKYNEKEWNINPESINLNFNTNEVIDEAYNYTRTDDIKYNLKRKLDLQLNNKKKFTLRASYDESKLSEEIHKICIDIDIPAKEASILIKDSSEIVTTESKEGREVDVVELKELIYGTIDRKKFTRIDLPVRVITPQIASQDVKSINSTLGQYSTSFNNSSARGNNIYVAGNGSSDIIVMPGEVYSFNKCTGARTWSKGYKTAKVIVGGKFVNGEGGGVCQVSTTIFNSALLAGMEIKEVHNHTIPSKYAPRGRDSAVSYGYSDLKFKNPYSHPVYIKNIINNGAITTKIYGCNQDREKIYIRTEEKYEKDKINVKTYRIYLDEENNKIREELISKSKYTIK
ncbi:MAG: VanW family protein [Peptostreptococcaceae bacterium]